MLCILGAAVCGCAASTPPPAAPPQPEASGEGADKAAGAASEAGTEGTQQEAADPLQTDGSLTTDTALVELLDGLGMTDVNVLEAGKIVFRMDGNLVALFRLEDGDLQLYYGIGGVRCPIESINEWNKLHRHSRSYVDDDGDPVIESDLLSDGGVSRHKLQVFVRTFYLSASEFQQLLRDQCNLPT